MSIGNRNRWERVVTVALIMAIVAGFAALGYVLVTPHEDDKFSEFYILGEEGKADDYPDRLSTKEVGSVIAGIVNHEDTEAAYRIEAVVGSKKISEVGPIHLADEEKWEGGVNWLAESPGENQKIEFLLYRDDEVEPYLDPLHLWVDIFEITDGEVRVAPTPTEIPTLTLTVIPTSSQGQSSNGEIVE